MSCIYYKFKASSDFDTIRFDGLTITLADVKAAIATQKKLGKSQQNTTLHIVNAQTGEEYTKDDQNIHKNTSVVVSRVPVGSLTGHLSPLTDQASQIAISMDGVQKAARIKQLMEASDMSQVDAPEEDKIQAMMQLSARGYEPSSYVRKPFQPYCRPTGVPNPTYVCFRCNNRGHFIYDCPLKGTEIDRAYRQNRLKRSTGIPNTFLQRVDNPVGPGVMLSGSGGFVVNKMDQAAFQEGKIERPPFLPNPQQKVVKEEKKIPMELLCDLCKDILTDAVVVPCCGNSFCDECIRNALLSDEDHQCPHCHEVEVSPDKLVSNGLLRKAIISFQNDGGYTKAKDKKAAEPVPQPAPQVAPAAPLQFSSTGVQLPPGSVPAGAHTFIIQPGQPLPAGMVVVSQPLSAAGQFVQAGGQTVVAGAPAAQTAVVVAASQPATAVVASAPTVADCSSLAPAPAVVVRSHNDRMLEEFARKLADTEAARRSRLRSRSRSPKRTRSRSRSPYRSRHSRSPYSPRRRSYSRSPYRGRRSVSHGRRRSCSRSPGRRSPPRYRRRSRSPGWGAQSRSPRYRSRSPPGGYRRYRGGACDRYRGDYDRYPPYGAPPGDYASGGHDRGDKRQAEPRSASKKGKIGMTVEEEADAIIARAEAEDAHKRERSHKKGRKSLKDDSDKENKRKKRHEKMENTDEPRKARKPEIISADNLDIKAAKKSKKIDERKECEAEMLLELHANETEIVDLLVEATRPKQKGLAEVPKRSKCEPDFKSVQDQAETYILDKRRTILHSKIVRTSGRRSPSSSSASPSPEQYPASEYHQKKSHMDDPRYTKSTVKIDEYNNDRQRMQSRRRDVDENSRRNVESSSHDLKVTVQEPQSQDDLRHKIRRGREQKHHEGRRVIMRNF